MGRLCGGAHEISGIHAPLFSMDRWLEGSWGGWVGCGGVGSGEVLVRGGVVDGWCVGEGWDGWCSRLGVGGLDGGGGGWNEN